MSSISCKNCEHHFKGNFCPHCGQSAKVEKIDLHYFMHDIPHSIFHIDKGFFFTFVNLFRRPGKTLKEYLAGKRVRHFRPFAYVIIMSTICALIMPQIEHLTAYVYLQKNPGQTVTYKQLFFEKYFSAFIFLMIPFVSFVTWLVFRKRQYNYWEHFLINTYIAAQLNIILLVIRIWGFIKVATGMAPGVNFSLFIAGFMTYYAIAFRVLMQPFGGKWKAFVYLLLMTVILAFVYLTALSFAGIMEPWWKLK